MTIAALVSGGSLRMGASGPAVKMLQRTLLAAGFDPKDVDGEFGPDTQAAVNAFRATVSMSPTGVMDIGAAMALDAYKPPAAASAPPWLVAARKEIGTREIPENRGPAVQRYCDLAHCGEQGEPWCAIFANAMLESVGVRGTRSPSSQSFRHDPNFVQISGPALGAITVYWRISRNSGLGHVGFYDGEDAHGFIDTIGGNESDMVRSELLNPHGSGFGLVGYYWPKTVPLPKIGKLPVQYADNGGSGKVT